MPEDNNSRIFDDAFATMVEEYPQVLIPTINEVFGTAYGKEEKVHLFRNEHHEKDGTIITDLYAGVRDGLYHVECQSNEDKEMVIRMLRYDFAIAWKNAEWGEEGCEVKFPSSCVLYLRSTKNTPDVMKVRLVLQNGQTSDYTVPVVKIKKYGAKEIFKKNLMLFLPFYMMRYERDIENNNEKQLEILYQELEDILCELEQCRRKAEKQGIYVTVNELFRKITHYMSNSNQKCQERMDEVMGGHVMELESIKLIHQGREEGLTEGQCQERYDNVMKIMENMGLSLEDACKALGITVKQYEEAKYIVENSKN